MTVLGAPQGLTNIGDEAKPPFAVLPRPILLFINRSKRLRLLAPGHPLQPYLNFIADLTQAQHDILEDLPHVELPPFTQIQQALKYGIPPLSRSTFEPGETAEATLEYFLENLRAKETPKEATDAIVSLIEASSECRRMLMSGALKDLPPDNIAMRALILAALQVHFARLGSELVADDLKPIADGICPVCGSPPMTSSVVGWPKAHNTRFCACSLCGTMWNAVRIKCLLCSSTEGISYQIIEGEPDSVKAETCDKCGGYVKILYQVNDHLLDPLSDDVATLGLDILVAEAGWKRGGVNPFLLGY